ncbi:MAG: hypothetical protein IJT49_01100 [Clostridia bacterium]|nr:hypothetical protein [Clostridia bacterium]
MATFTNQATLTYNNTQTLSNVTTGQILQQLTVEKTSLQQSYAAGERLTYAVSFVNSGTTDDQNLTLTDDLGAFVPTGLTEEVYPLTYDTGSVFATVNGAVQTAVQVTSEQPLTLTGINVPAGGSAVIIYTAQVNGSAPLASGSTIENTVTVTGGGLAEPVTATESVSVSEAPYLTVEKTLSPLTVTSSQRITYTFLISNYGNAPAEADANASITDVLSPVLTGLTATYNGVLWTQGTEYTYSETSGIFTSDPGAITVPAATYTTLPDGTVSTTPGTATLLLEGTVG